MGAIFLVAFNALLSFVIFALGAGVPRGFHTAMGWYFVALNVAAAVLFFQAPVPKPMWRIALLAGVVPLEVLSIFAAGPLCVYLEVRC